MIKSSHFIIGTTLTLLLLSGCARKSSEQSNSLQIKGSDTMVNLGQAWAEAYMKQNPGTSIAVTGGGSGTGISAMVNNTCDIAEVSREMKESEIALVESKGFTPKKIIVALDGLAVVVNPANKNLRTHYRPACRCVYRKDQELERTRRTRCKDRFTLS